MRRSKDLNKSLAAVVLFCSGVVLAQNTLTPDPASLKSQEAQAAAKVVTKYYRARNHFDLATARSLEASDIVLVNEKGEERQGHPEKLQGFMDYEKYMHGRWHCRVLAFHNGLIEAEVTEENDYYRYLGSGRAILLERYLVRAGKIQRAEVLRARYDGRDQDSAADEFLDWVKEVHPEKLELVHPNGHLVFDGQGARQQLPLMKEYHSNRKPN